MDEEMRSHIEMQTQENLEAGMTPAEARRQALLEFGAMESIKERCREERRGRGWESWMQDLRSAARIVMKNPGFTTVAVLTLMVGIGANTVVFSVARMVWQRPLGFAGEDRLVWIQRENLQTGAAEDDLSWRDMEDIRAGAGSFEFVGTFGSSSTSWEDGEQRTEVPVLQASVGLGDALRLRPVLGRLLEAGDAVGNGGPVAMIRYELWQSRFGGRADVIGQAVRLGERSRTIVGVLPAGLRFPLQRVTASGTDALVRAEQHAFWIPMETPRGEDATSRGARMFPAMGRLKPGLDEATARAELAALGRRLGLQYPEWNRGWGFGVLSFRDQVFGRTRQGIPLLIAAVGLVLAICCVNLANLLLARGVAREREFTIRIALGAGRVRLARALMTENLLLAFLGGVAGVGFAHGVVGLIRRLAASSVPFIGEVRVDGVAVGFTAVVSLLTALVFGLLPALRHTRVEPVAALRTGTRASGGPRIHAWQQALLVGQVAVVLVLLAAGGLLMESFRRLVGQDLGYQPESVVALDLSQSGFDTNGDVCRMYRSLRERLAALPGVDAVGTISSAPLTRKWTFDERPNLVGQPVPLQERPTVAATFVAFDYFQAMGILLREGRFFRDDELNDDGYGQIVILNETAAALLFPGRSAIGGQFTVGSNPDRVLEVIGVVKDTRDVRLEEKPVPRFYWQYAFGGAQVVVRGRGPADALVPMLRRTVEQLDRRVRIQSVRPMAEIVASTVAERRFLMLLVTAFAGASLAIAAVGIFGVMAFQVAQRTNEFGVRLALGASPGSIQGLVMRRAGCLALLGLGVGLGVSAATNRALASQLFGLTPYDPVLLMSVSGILMLTALLAGFVPARRAARMDPMVALRTE